MKESNKKLQDDLKRLSEKMESVSRQKRKKVTPSPEIRVSDNCEYDILYRHTICIIKFYYLIIEEQSF